MTWTASLADMKSALDGRFVDLQNAVQSAMTAVNCYSYAEGIDALDRLVKLAEETRELYEAIEDKEMEMQAEEYEKEYQKKRGFELTMDVEEGEKLANLLNVKIKEHK